jgi:pSer/pThr/pTyr-binding forkhead associated (FHA) protein
MRKRLYNRRTGEKIAIGYVPTNADYWKEGDCFVPEVRDMIIGTSDFCDIVLPKKLLSKASHFHAGLYYNPNDKEIVLVDLGSRNGTTLCRTAYNQYVPTMKAGGIPQERLLNQIRKIKEKSIERDFKVRETLSQLVLEGRDAGIRLVHGDKFYLGSPKNEFVYKEEPSR